MRETLRGKKKTKKNFSSFQRPQTGEETFEDIRPNGVWVSEEHWFFWILAIKVKLFLQK